MRVKSYTLILKAEPEGGYTVIVPALPGCVTYGKDLGEARKMAVEAIAAYLASLRKHKEPIPSDSSVLLTTVSFASGKVGGESLSYA